MSLNSPDPSKGRPRLTHFVLVFFGVMPFAIAGAICLLAAHGETMTLATAAGKGWPPGATYAEGVASEQAEVFKHYRAVVGPGVAIAGFIAAWASRGNRATKILSGLAATLANYKAPWTVVVFHTLLVWSLVGLGRILAIATSSDPSNSPRDMLVTLPLEFLMGSLGFAVIGSLSPRSVRRIHIAVISLCVIATNTYGVANGLISANQFLGRAAIIAIMAGLGCIAAFLLDQIRGGPSAHAKTG